jgi:hypothetical protein
MQTGLTARLPLHQQNMDGWVTASGAPIPPACHMSACRPSTRSRAGVSLGTLNPMQATSAHTATPFPWGNLPMSPAIILSRCQACLCPLRAPGACRTNMGRWLQQQLRSNLCGLLGRKAVHVPCISCFCVQSLGCHCRPALASNHPMLNHHLEPCSLPLLMLPLHAPCCLFRPTLAPGLP